MAERLLITLGDLMSGMMALRETERSMLTVSFSSSTAGHDNRLMISSVERGLLVALAAPPIGTPAGTLISGDSVWCLVRMSWISRGVWLRLLSLVCSGPPISESALLLLPGWASSAIDRSGVLGLSGPALTGEKGAGSREASLPAENLWELVFEVRSSELALGLK